jgi:hypothetical protein
MNKEGGPSSEKLVDLRIAHLNMIQGIISRMSAFSASAKNFCITIIAAVVTISLDKGISVSGWAPVSVILIFLLVDAYYLALEKRYRALYEQVARRPLSDATQLGLTAENPGLSTYFTAARSPSVGGFYTLLLIGVAFLLFIGDRVEPKAAKPTPVSAGGVLGATTPTDPVLVVPHPSPTRREESQPAGARERVEPIRDAPTEPAV